jgi:hypothetical protein
MSQHTQVLVTVSIISCEKNVIIVVYYEIQSYVVIIVGVIMVNPKNLFQFIHIM